MRTTVTVVSDVGKARANNEDNFVVMNQLNADFDHWFHFTDSIKDPIQFFGVFDGMGGQSDGEIAALTAAVGYRKAARVGIQSDILSWLTNIQLSLNADVCEIARAHKNRLGSTSTLLVLSGARVHLSHLGDSRCYRYRQHQLEQMTIDHLYKSRTSTGASKGKLAQYLGVFEHEHILEPQSISWDCQHDDLYVLCSDGVSDVLSNERIQHIIDQLKDPDRIARQVIDRCRENAAPDNCTVIIIKVETESWFESVAQRVLSVFVK